MDKHFTVSVFVVCEDKVLLHLHKKAKKILPLGGHIEVNESPEEACIREVKEEAGLNISLYNKIDKNLKEACDLSGEKLLINPIHSVFGKVGKDHYHMDFVYYGISESFDCVPGDLESKVLKWYSKEDLKMADNIQSNILIMANEALDLLCKK